MERKDYEEKFMGIKNEILQEIRGILGNGVKHHFKETFYIHYVEGETATTEVCSALETDNNGMVIFHVINEVQDAEKIEGEGVFPYDPESFLDILDNLKKEVRENKLAQLREIVKRNNGLHFDGSFKLNIDDGSDGANGCSIAENCHLTGLELMHDGTLAVHNNFEGEAFINEEDSLLFEDIDRLLSYVRSQTYRKFVIRVSGSFSRTFDVNASSYEEALALAKKDWEVNPLYFGDSNGEDWEDYTSLAH